MKNAGRTFRKAALVGLDDSLHNLLAEALMRCGCRVAPKISELQGQSANIIFCGDEKATLLNTLKAAGKTPVVVASRLPEVSRWLDALEAGAADYCAAPFETIQMNWLMERHAPMRAAAAA